MADYSDYKECTDCVHYELCLHQEKFLIEHNRKDLIRRYGFGLSEPEICCNFRDRSRFVELPCKAGQKIFRIKNGKIQEGVATAFFYGKEFHIVNCKFSKTDTGIPFHRFGKTVFLTREEAEAALKEREGK